MLKQQKFNSDKEKEILALEDTNRQLLIENDALKQNTTSSFLSGKMKWFLVGGGVLLLGFIMGRSAKRKKSYRY